VQVPNLRRVPNLHRFAGVPTDRSSSVGWFTLFANRLRWDIYIYSFYLQFYLQFLIVFHGQKSHHGSSSSLHA